MAINSTFNGCRFKSQRQQDNVDFYGERFQILSIIVTFLASLLSPSIVIGNGFVIVALLRKEWLRTPTNILICVLAMADCFIGLFFLPMFTSWVLDYALNNACIYQGLLFSVGWIGCGASFLGMVAVSIERYMALFLHLKYHSVVTVLKVTIIGIISWLVPITVAVLFMVGYFKEALLITLICLIPGLMIITIIYYKIFRLVKRHQNQIQAQEIGITNNTARQRKLAITMAYVVGVSLLCYVPIFFTGIIAVALDFSVRSKEALGFSNFLFTISSFCNPIIYCRKNQEIRNAVFSFLSDLKSACFGCT
jgi:hypothetical protein